MTEEARSKLLKMSAAVLGAAAVVSAVSWPVLPVAQGPNVRIEVRGDAAHLAYRLTDEGDCTRMTPVLRPATGSCATT